LLEDPEILEIYQMDEIKSMEEFEDRYYIKMV
jgi:phenolic acid decarboxylase